MNSISSFTNLLKTTPKNMNLQRTNKLFSPKGIQVRNLNLHEYQSKALMDKFDVNCQKWTLVENDQQIKEGAKQLFSYIEKLKKENSKLANKIPSEVVVKAQIHAGGRGKGHFNTGFKGGVHVCEKVEDVVQIAKKMLGNKLITKQTPPDGVLVRKVLLCCAVNFEKEKYFAILMDRGANGPVLVGSPQGGMDIETVAEKTPDQIFKEVVDIKTGPTIDQTKKLAKKLGFADIDSAAEQMRNLYTLFIKTDATQVEINPFVETTDQRIISIDAKINFDDNASFRQKEIFQMRDITEEDPREVAASEHNLNYIGMTGDIGCMVNGAGLAMATMDIIKLYKGDPANFLDVGGGANAKQITEAFKIISGDNQVKAILVNIFGGIMRCDIIATGIVEALKQLKVNQPIVVRLAGTNVDLGKKILKESGYNIVSADDLDDAAQKAVKASHEVKKK